MSKLYFYLPFLLVLALSCASSGNNTNQPGDETLMDTNNKLDTATLGAGCFWCVEAIFQNLEGVHSVYAGYAGGHVNNPTYKQVCDGGTGHVEVAQITYDPVKISFEELLHVFWKTHDPTTLNRQGNDVGDQYRSVIFYHNENQKAVAEKSKQEMDASGYYDSPIVTAIEPLSNYSKAEDYHQNYFKYNSKQPYCQMVIQPKVEKFKKEFKEKLKK
ncbi:MAG: peptide-methionine (S)-S-oxide reductase MsrA [Chitinophagales bacterium]|nr:peptide-methionine (S)-S-oxide reductase MsrA [Chitinophagales bacterium]